ncbi:MAG: cob(I)yrinic acid a,c-diamide adenosyltransferase [Kiritimatiellia bacterium]
MKRCVHVYTGDGKGKTTAALGLIARAVGAGWRVYMGQFMKRGDYCEAKTLKDRFPDVTLEQYGTGKFMMGEPFPGDIAAAREGFERIEGALSGGEYDLVVADELITAVNAGLIGRDEVCSLMDNRAPEVELVLTGRNADEELIKRGDVVTEMLKVKHYMDEGVKARKGVER